jgi:hypothetical protein
MEFLVYAPLKFKHTVTVDLFEAADEDRDHSDVLWRSPTPPPLPAPGAICGYPYRSKGAILALRLAEIWRKID